MTIVVTKNREYMAEPIIDWILSGIPVPVDVKLFDDVSFIYEAQLAKLELSNWWKNLEEFRKRAAYYETVNGRKTFHYFISEIKGKGQIGRTNQYLTHWYYPYKAKFHPQMVKALINWMGLRRGQRLLDPFAGSGTAMIESKLIGVNSIGIDIDPFCVLMGKVKTDLLDIHPDSLTKITLKTAFEFFLLSYLYALSDFTYIQKDMWKAFQKNTSEIMKSVQMFHDLKTDLNIELGTTEIRQGDARFLEHEGLPRGSIDGIVTSPPYSIAVDYIANDLHTFKYLGIEADILQDKLVGLKGKHEDRVRIYFEDMEKTFQSMFNVLKNKAKCAILIGDVTFEGTRLPITRRFIEIAESVGFRLIDVIRRPILGGFARLRYEYMILLEKPS